MMDVLQPRTDEEDIAGKTQETESPPPMPRKETSPADAMPVDADAETAVGEKPDVHELPGEITPVVDETVETASIEAETESAIDKILSLPEQDNVDSADDEPAELETSEEHIIDLAEAEAVQQESETLSTPDVSISSDESAEETKVHSEEAMQPENEADVAVEAEAGSIPESTGETILLEVADEVQPLAGEPSEKSEKTAKLDPSLQIEKAVEDTAAANDQQKAELDQAQKIRRQKIALAKAQAVKKQKEALAKTRAQKRQKMILAKDAALKRKKAVQAKAQAITKQVPAAKNTAATDKPKVVQILETNTRMQGLLEKYKGQAIGINYDNSAEIREAQLVEANNEFFSVLAENKKLYYTYPIKSILTVIEGQDGVEVGKSKEKVKFNVVIKVYPLVLF
jgi:hypothetical protein